MNRMYEVRYDSFIRKSLFETVIELGNVWQMCGKNKLVFV